MLKFLTRFFVFQSAILAVFILVILAGRLMSPAEASPGEQKSDKPTALTAAEPISLIGYYSVDGEQGGKAYQGVVLIVQRDDVYIVQWAGSSNVGIGFIEDGKLIVGFAGNEEKAMRGACSFTIGKRRLVGRWASLPGDGKVHTETLTWLRGVKEESKENEPEK